MTESAPQMMNATDTDAILTGFVDGDGTAADGLDETGAPTFQGCLLGHDDNPLAIGFVHQCSAEYDLTFSFDFNPIVGSTVPLSFGTSAQTLNDSTYEHPFAAACCSDIEDDPRWSSGGDTCALVAHRACYSDLVQHLCGVPAVWLADAANDFTLNGETALQEAAKWFKDHRNDCYDHFWTGSDALYQAEYCGTAFDVFYNHPAWEPSKTFRYSIPGIGSAKASNFSLSPRTLFSTVGVQTLPANPTQCEEPVDNDGEVPPLSEPSGGSILTAPAAAVPLNVIGPLWAGEVITGSGNFGADSWLAYQAAGSHLSIEGWTMLEEASTRVGTSSVTSNVSVFRLNQVGAATATASGRVFRIKPGGGLFHFSASIDGVSDYVVASNSTRLDFYYVRAGVGSCPFYATRCLVNRRFTVTYTDAFGDDWDLNMGSATWVP